MINECLHKLSGQSPLATRICGPCSTALHSKAAPTWGLKVGKFHKKSSPDLSFVQATRCMLQRCPWMLESISRGSLVMHLLVHGRLVGRSLERCFSCAVAKMFLLQRYSKTRSDLALSTLDQVVKSAFSKAAAPGRRPVVADSVGPWWTSRPGSRLDLLVSRRDGARNGSIPRFPCRLRAKQGSPP